MNKKSLILFVVLLGIGVFLSQRFRGSNQNPENTPPVVVNGNSDTVPVTQTEVVDPHAAPVRLNKANSVVNTRGISFDKIIRYRKDGSKGSRLYSIVPGDGFVEEKVIGLGVHDPEKHQLGDMRQLFQCAKKSSKGDSFVFLATNGVCDGYGVPGKPLNLYLPTTLVDASFIPLYSCITKETVLYLSLNRLCENQKDSVASMLGYVKAANIQTY